MAFNERRLTDDNETFDPFVVSRHPLVFWAWFLLPGFTTSIRNGSVHVMNVHG